MIWDMTEKIKAANDYKDRYSFHIDQCLKDVKSNLKPAPEDWNKNVKRVCVILTSSRGGSSLLKEVLSRNDQIVSLPGEEEPYYIMTRNVFPFGSESDGILKLKGKKTILDMMYNDLGVPVRSMNLAKIARDWNRRLIMQFPEIRFNHIDELVENCYGTSDSYEEGTELFLKALLGVKSGYYDVMKRNYDFIEEFKIEEPPFVVPGNKRPMTTDDLKSKVLLFKTPQNYCRPGIFEDMFPNAEIKYIHLTRGWAQSVNGLMDGWLSDTGFFSYNVDVIDEELTISGYSDVKKFGRKWWNFDLFPGWQQFTDTRLIDVCTRQWYSAHDWILNNYTPGLTVKFENFLSDKQGVLNQICSYIGIDPWFIDDLPDVMVTSKPKPYRWHKRKDELLDFITGANFRGRTNTGTHYMTTTMMRKLGYSTDPETWI